MKLIDDKGKIFGIINLIDLIVALLIILIIGGLVYKTQSGKNVAQLKEVYITVRVPNLLPDTAASLKPGDKLISGNYYTTDEIVDVKVSPALSVNTNSEGKMVLTTNPYRKDAIVLIKAHLDTSSPTVRMGQQDIRVGNQITVKTHFTVVQGEIIKVDVK
ncbi:DUF4330 domain-containing protein [Caldanaerobius polysaccharolyticus]|uniref:DUF4330 domain-containing protein n=1 Tax=Caldanaerobius polysaccharolyticus TaxID=44256 RepID=UPI00047B83E4|nr:DUF4330 domain-containing protein [Caldanaerobius polysaccharolyticus]